MLLQSCNVWLYGVNYLKRQGTTAIFFETVPFHSNEISLKNHDKPYILDEGDAKQIDLISTYFEQIARTIDEKGIESALRLFFHMAYFSDYFDYVKSNV